MDPGLANAEGSSLADDVASADWVHPHRVLGRLAASPTPRWTSAPTRPNQVLRDHFCEVGDYEDGLVRLYRRCR